MTPKYAQAQYAEAQSKHADAMRRYNAEPKWNAHKREAAEDAEFWSSKTAFFSNACGQSEKKP